jgi:hypothetical protein
VKPESFSWYHPDDLGTIRPHYSILNIFGTFIWNGMFWDLLQTWTLDLYIDVFWYGVIQRGHSPFIWIALPSSLMFVAKDGIGILPLICAARLYNL